MGFPVDKYLLDLGSRTQALKSILLRSKENEERDRTGPRDKEDQDVHDSRARLYRELDGG